MSGIAVEALAVERGGVPVLEGLSFDVAPGAALVIRGPNGVGKTTLLRVLAGLQAPLEGRIGMAPDAAAYASHADGVKATLTVRENLAFWADLYGQRLDDCVFAAFDLERLADRMAGTLSAGQKRRAGLARLAVIGRRVLLLDEPTVSLDSASVALFAGWLREVHLARGGVAVIATHIDLGLDAPVFDLTPYRATADARGGSDEAFL
jgi:heme exporter protein A